MCATVAKANRAITLFDVSPQTYKAIANALADRQFHLSYNAGTLELESSLLHGVDWQTYTKLVRAFGDRHFRHTYQEGTLEIMMSPSEDHEQIKSLMGRLIEIACLELKIHFKAVGSATRRNKKLLQGLEPDESFYIPCTAARSRKVEAAMGKKPPPDLAIEIDLRKPPVARLETYAKLGIRELWCYRKAHVEFFVLAGSGAYEPVVSSRVFPMIGPDDIARFIGEMQASDDYVATQSFVTWLRKKNNKSAPPRKKET